MTCPNTNPVLNELILKERERFPFLGELGLFAHIQRLRGPKGEALALKALSRGLKETK